MKHMFPLVFSNDAAIRECVVTAVKDVYFHGEALGLDGKSCDMDDNTEC